MVTGNHYLMDGAVAVGLLAGACAVALSIPSQRPQRFVRYLERRSAAQAQRELDVVAG